MTCCRVYVNILSSYNHSYKRNREISITVCNTFNMMQHLNDDSHYFQEESIKCQNLTFKIATGHHTSCLVTWRRSCEESLTLDIRLNPLSISEAVIVLKCLNLF